jgi:hypothetical protein
MVAGSSRQHLAGALNAAFAQGLLSEHTLSYRLSLLFGPQLIDQGQLIGDLTLRRENSRRSAPFRKAWSALVATMRPMNARVEPLAASLLLVLDRAESERLLVGRHPSCDVVVDAPSVSRRHAQLTHRAGTWVIQDLASTNGTWVNGERVGRTALRAGDILTLGSQPILLD